VAGRLVPKGTTVALSYGGADRDPSRYADADEVHLDRKGAALRVWPRAAPVPGLALARLELRLTLEAAARADSRVLPRERD
jgi:cytochrome P450